MESFERQTDFSLEDLEEFIDSPQALPCGGGRMSACSVGSLPAGGLVNEIGTIFINEDPPQDAANAELLLTRLLDHGMECVRFVAYCFLKQGEVKTAETTKEKLFLFEQKTDNQPLVSEAQRRYAFA